MEGKHRTETIICIICALICVWLIICWANVVLHNGNANYDYPWWNLFTWITKGGN